MDYYLGLAVLGVDCIAFCCVFKEYLWCKKALGTLKNVVHLEIDDSLKNTVLQNPDQKIDYAAIKGTVESIGKPLQSLNDKAVFGVVQYYKVKELVSVKTSSGRWENEQNVLKKILNSVPFVLKKDRYSVEVIDPLQADILSMETVSNTFVPSKPPSFIDHVWDFFNGHRPQGIQTTEEMLREGSIINGIGELAISSAKPYSLILRPPSDGSPFYLTTMSVTSLLTKIDTDKAFFRLLCLVFGAVGVLLGGILLRQYLKDKYTKKAVDGSRRERRERVRDVELREDQICVVCRTNPREIILLPCGHVCLCEDCSLCISSDCPVCRAHIAQRAAAYIA